MSDGVESISATFTLTVLNVNDPPVLTAISDTTISEETTLGSTLKGEDIDGDVLSYGALDLPLGAELDTGTGQFRWKPDFDQAGEYKLTFTVTDGELSDSQTFTLTVKNTNRPPEFVLIEDKTVHEAAPLTFLLSAVDPDGDALVYEAQDLPEGATLKDSVVTWQPGFEQSGAYTLSFTVTDDKGASDSTQVRITVLDVNRNPVLIALPDTTINEEQLLEVVVMASDADGDSLTYTAADLPQGAMFNASTKQFSWRPEFGQTGTYTITFSVDDGREGVDTESLKVTVRDITPPSFTIGILQNPIAASNLDIYIVPSERLQDLPSVEIADTSVSVIEIDATVPIYKADYTLSATVTFVINTKGRDLVGNEGTGSKAFTAQYIFASQGGVARTADKIVTLNIPGGALSKDRYVLIQTPISAEGAGRLSKAVSGFSTPSQAWDQEAIGKPYSIEPAGLQLARNAMLTFRHPEIHEGAVGIYRWEDNRWTYLTTYLDLGRNMATAFVQRLGTYQLRRVRPTDIETLPTSNDLSQGFPNPFNSEVSIQYQIAQEGIVDLSIYNILGQLVRTIVEGYQPAGRYIVHWDGKDMNGIEVASGLYLYRLKIGGFVASRKIIFSK